MVSWRHAPPATRQLAAELQVSRNTVIAVWSQLQVEGFILSDRRKPRQPTGTPLPAQASDDSADWPVSARASGCIRCIASPAELALRPSTPALAHFPLAQWRRALNQTAQQAQLLGYGDPLVSWRCVRHWRSIWRWRAAARRSRL